MEPKGDILRDLRPERLPAFLADPGWADLLAAFSLGLIAGALVWLALRPFMRAVPTRRTSVEAELAALAGLPGGERLLGQARLVLRHGGALDDAEAAALYDPRRKVDHAALDHRILRLSRGAA